MRDTPAEPQNDQSYKVQVGDPTDELGNAWPGVWGDFQLIPPYLEEARLKQQAASTMKGALK